MPLPHIRLLVVDDDQSVRTSIVRYFEDRECTVLSAGSAEEALDVLAAEPVDVAIIDIRLPGTDDDTLILKAHVLSPLVRYIIYTGSAKYNLPSELVDIGIAAEDVFRKPLSDLGILASAVHRVAQGHEYPDDHISTCHRAHHRE
ncbi:MAG: response regulator [Phycisphaerales bacterium]|nr:MAG: response regulator [Phycisphaerales bacterium]